MAINTHLINAITVLAVMGLTISGANACSKGVDFTAFSVEPLKTVDVYAADGGSWPSELTWALDIDTGYFPLQDVMPELALEVEIGEHEMLVGGEVVERPSFYDDVMSTYGPCTLVLDGKGNYIAVMTVSNEHGYEDIQVVKYDSSGNVVAERLYGGSDFDMLRDAKYGSGLGLILYGYTQSEDGDFASEENTAFVACVDDELDIKWIYTPKDDEVLQDLEFVSKDAVFMSVEKVDVRSYRDNYFFVIGLDEEGHEFWRSEPAAHRVISAVCLSDDRRLINAECAENMGTFTLYDVDGNLILSLVSPDRGDVTPLDDGGFVSVDIRNVKTVPQPAYISSIWFDTETVVTRYDSELKVLWRKTYDGVIDEQGVDIIHPLKDGRLVVELADGSIPKA